MLTFNERLPTMRQALCFPCLLSLNAQNHSVNIELLPTQFIEIKIPLKVKLKMRGDKHIV